MYRNLSDLKDQCIACNYCKRFLMYLYIDRRHLSLIDPSRYGSTQLPLNRSLPDGHWQLQPASFVTPVVGSTQISKQFRAVYIRYCLLGSKDGWRLIDYRDYTKGPASREVLSFNIIRKNCILCYFYINIIKGTNYKLYIIFSYYNILHDMTSCYRQLERIYY
jgi:hypothetical protein